MKFGRKTSYLTFFGNEGNFIRKIQLVRSAFNLEAANFLLAFEGAKSSVYYLCLILICNEILSGWLQLDGLHNRDLVAELLKARNAKSWILCLAIRSLTKLLLYKTSHGRCYYIFISLSYCFQVDFQRSFTFAIKILWQCQEPRPYRRDTLLG